MTRAEQGWHGQYRRSVNIRGTRLSRTSSDMQRSVFSPSLCNLLPTRYSVLRPPHLHNRNIQNSTNYGFHHNAEDRSASSLCFQPTGIPRSNSTAQRHQLGANSFGATASARHPAFCLPNRTSGTIIELWRICSSPRAERVHDQSRTSTSRMLDTRSVDI